MIKRYSISMNGLPPYPDNKGKWVKWQDYELLQRENQKLKNGIAAENEEEERKENK